MMQNNDESLLDNPVWNSLNGPLKRFARTPASDRLLTFDPDMNPFSGVEMSRTGGASGCWAAIAEDVGLEGFCGLFRDEVPARPVGWEDHFDGVCLQMVAGDLGPPSDVAIEVLGPKDAEAALELATLTEPGPFAARTTELGRFVGVRRDGRLMAMAGERFRVPGFVEISGVCTHPDVRGEGLAGALTLEVARSIRAGGDEAFLHVLEDNENAIRLYEKLGFNVRRKVDVVFAQWHGAEWTPSEED